MSQIQQPIQQLVAAEFGAFLDYLNDHLSDNGRGATAHFQPLSRADSHLPQEKVDAFQRGLLIAVGMPGWRRVWVARAADGRIAGHVDLRAHGERYATHRCLLGMGVDRAHRGAGLGAELIAHAAHWARVSAGLAWIDLQVLSVNAPAIKLYLRSGFQKTGEVLDMFEIDGQMLSYTGMSLRLAAPPSLPRRAYLSHTAD